MTLPPIMSLSDEQVKRLLALVENATNTGSMTNRELAGALVDATDKILFPSREWDIMMEAADRLCPDLFDEAGGIRA